MSALLIQGDHADRGDYHRCPICGAWYEPDVEGAAHRHEDLDGQLEDAAAFAEDLARDRAEEAEMLNWLDLAPRGREGQR